MNPNTVNCKICQYYFVTWDPARPMGCRAFGFKSQVMPSIEVYKASGAPCKAFSPKKIPK